MSMVQLMQNSQWQVRRKGRMFMLVLICFYLPSVCLKVSDSFSHNTYGTLIWWFQPCMGARCTSMVKHLLMGHHIDLSFSFQPELHNWCNKVHGMCYASLWNSEYKRTLLLIKKNSLRSGSSGFLISMSDPFLCLMPYN